MLELFMFSITEILTSLRFIIITILLCWSVLLVISCVFRTIRAASLGRFLFKVGGKIAWWEIPKYVIYCYKSTRWDIKKTWDNGNYWEGVGKWRYFDKKKNKYINGRYSKDKW